jgi:ankyrin repeat protein
MMSLQGSILVQKIDQGDVEAIELLLNDPATDLNVQDLQENAYFDRLLSTTKSKQNSSIKIFKLLLKNGVKIPADTQALYNQAFPNTLFKTIVQGNIEQAKELSDKLNARVDLKDDENSSVLLYCVGQGQLAMVDFLLEHPKITVTFEQIEEALALVRKIIDRYKTVFQDSFPDSETEKKFAEYTMIELCLSSALAFSERFFESEPDYFAPTHYGFAGVPIEMRMVAEFIFWLVVMVNIGLAIKKYSNY